MKAKFNLNSVSIDFSENKKNKRPVVFVHGNSQNDTCGYGLKKYFVSKGHSYLSYDLPGHGNSPLETEAYVFADLVDLNYRLIEKYALSSPILIGHSLGGMIQAGTISRYKLSDSSLILCGSLDSDPITSAIKHHQNDTAKIIAASMDAYVSQGFKLFKKQKKYNYYENNQVEDMLYDIFNRRYNSPIASAINIKSLTNFDAREILIAMNIPILVLHGVDETIIPKVVVKKMISQYNNMQVGWYPNRGHHAFFQDPELTNKYLDQNYNFINKST